MNLYTHTVHSGSSECSNMRTSFKNKHVLQCMSRTFTAYGCVPRVGQERPPTLVTSLTSECIFTDPIMAFRPDSTQCIERCFQWPASSVQRLCAFSPNNNPLYENLSVGKNAKECKNPKLSKIQKCAQKWPKSKCLQKVVIVEKCPKKSSTIHKSSPNSPPFNKL